MNPRSIRVVFLKELRDLLRDRRTILSMVVMPVVVIPVLMLGLGGLTFKMVKQAAEEAPTVMILGETNSPSVAAHIRALPRIEVVPAAANFTNLISNRELRAAVEIPPGYDAALEAGEPATIRVYHYQGEIRSEFGAEMLREFLRDLRDLEVSNRLARHNLSPEILRPFEIVRTNVAPPEKVSGTLLGAIIPYIIILMTLTGAMYPAMDLTAGEKERGTIETLLCSPAGRVEIVLGKFLMVLLAGVATTLLSLLSMGGSFLVAARAGRHVAAELMDFPLAIEPGSLLLVFLLMVPVAVLFAALLLALSLFARSYKEAQSYVSPLLIVVILPAVASVLPGVELDAVLALVPVLNVSLGSKEILMGMLNWGHLGLIVVSSTVYAAGALAFAVWLFQRESVLFRS